MALSLGVGVLSSQANARSHELEWVGAVGGRRAVGSPNGLAGPSVQGQNQAKVVGSTAQLITFAPSPHNPAAASTKSKLESLRPAGGELRSGGLRVSGEAQDLRRRTRQQRRMSRAKAAGSHPTPQPNTMMLKVRAQQLIDGAVRALALHLYH